MVAPALPDPPPPPEDPLEVVDGASGFFFPNQFIGVVLRSAGDGEFWRLCLASISLASLLAS